MIASRFVRRSALALWLAAAASPAFAQTGQATKPFEPTVGQQGKDVVWVPTSDSMVRRMLDIAKVGPNDFLMDLGSGDGRTVIAAAKRGARAMGIEYNPDMVALSERNAKQEGIAPDRAQFMKADLFETDLSKATVITMFLLPDINLKLRPKILDLKPGTRVVSNTFTMQEWVADETATVTDGCTSWCTVLFWVVPAKVAGTWRMPEGELSLTQEFQQLSGTLTRSGKATPITYGKMRGEEISFTIGNDTFTGRVNGNTMQLAGANGTKMTASRSGN
jgi:precorrin-6B methylase 2